MRKLSTLLLVVLFCPLWLLAQDRMVSGKVVGDDGSPLPGVTVLIKGTTNGTSSDADGNYKISVGSNATLLFSFIGFKTQEVAVGSQSTINVKLASDDKMLSEIVVTGYGTQEKREITGSITSLKGDVIQNLPLQSFDRALQGRAAGVLVQSANGAPGGAVQVRIRGIGSISAGNDPLYIVDGVQLNGANNAGLASGNPLSFLNPNDIESMEVLKDAAAASIYGAQAANGVVLITTKKGKSGSKTRVNFNYYRGLVEPIQKYNVLNTQQFIQARTEAVQNNRPTSSPDQVRGLVLGSLRLPTTLTPAEIAALPTYDWQKEAYKNGQIDNYELSMSGGSDKTTFYLSGSYNREDANVIAVDFKRYTGRLNITHQVNSKLSLDASINGSFVDQGGAFGSPNGGSFLGSPSFSSPLILPHNPIYKEDGTFNGLPAEGGIAGILNQNILLPAVYNTNRNSTRQAVGNLTLNYKVNDYLSVRAFAGIDYRLIRGLRYSDARTADAFGVNGRLYEELDENFNQNYSIILNFNKTFNSIHRITAMGGVEYRMDTREGSDMTGIGFPTPQFRTINSAATPEDVSGFWTGFSRASALGRVNYDLKGRYFVSVTGRYDGSSRFGANNLYGFFPAVSAAWLITEESFLKNNKIVSNLKLRASVGITGNDDIGNFSSRGLYGGGNNYNNIAGIAPTSLANPNLRWERNVSTNFGIDFGFLNNRISGSVEVYRRDSKDLLLNRPIPGTSGFAVPSNLNPNITTNAGELRNEGIEFEVKTTNFDASGFRWQTDFNFSITDNKILSLVDGLQVLPGNQGIRVGQPINALFLREYAGVNPATGRPMWYDINGNITYRPLDPADGRVLGKNFSNIFGGFTNTFSYKGLELSVFFQYEFGRKAINNQNQFMMENGGRLFNGLTDIYERRWQKPGDITDVPRPIENNAELGSIGTTSGSRVLQDASYIRLKQVTLSYSLPENLLSKVRLSNVRIYGQAFNLLTWTKWEGLDPEFVSLGGNGNNGVIPQARKFTVGVQIGF